MIKSSKISQRVFLKIAMKHYDHFWLALMDKILNTILRQQGHKKGLTQFLAAGNRQMSLK